VVAKRKAGQGGILAFHRVYRSRPHEFGSQSLSTTPENFRRIIQTLVDRRYDFLTMSALADRLLAPEPVQEKFVCLTFDDGYADNYTEAHRICQEFGVPMTVYLVSGFVRRSYPMWPPGLENVLAANRVVEFTWKGRKARFGAHTMAQKRRAYWAITSFLAVAQPREIRRVCAELGRRYGVDFMALTDRNTLTLAMIREMRESGAVEFGAHTVRHLYLSRLTDALARREIVQSKRDCEALVGAEVRHFAYPYGDAGSFGSRELDMCSKVGFRTAVTTDSNTIFASDQNRLLALPRLTYNGRYQSTPLLDLLLSGTLPALRRVLRGRSTSAAVTNALPLAGSGAASDFRGMPPG
jgi:peptidoglycan/xylan/chitin deacetylase (PgdA/CDA1 family)